jgi:serine protease AprX
MENNDQMAPGRMNEQPEANPSEGELPSVGMNYTPDPSQNFAPEKNSSQSADEMQNVLVEMRVPRNQGLSRMSAGGMSIPGFQLDSSFEPVPMGAPQEQSLSRTTHEADEEVVLVRGTIEKSKIAELEAQPQVVRVLPDTQIAPFTATLLEDRQQQAPAMRLEPMGTCPTGSCDCSPSIAKGTIADVAKDLGVDQLWAAGYKGEGIVIGIVDGGITAQGRSVISREQATPKIARVIGGWPTESWGTQAGNWGNHGNMTATDALGMAPQAQIYDIRISDGSFLSSAIAGLQWAINQHRTDSTPQILSNSWGIFQEAWDSVYARDPSHPLTRKVVEAINEGILVLFAAGNCGGTCPDNRCGGDSGPGKSIWGANGHPEVMTIGAVNRNQEFVGYSSQGPAALDDQKPDFCAITHFQGYFGCDCGTSAATPIAAGVVALLKQANPTLTQGEVKQILKDTAKNIGSAGWNPHAGFGIIQAKAAFDRMIRPTPAQWSRWERLGGLCFSAPTATTRSENIDIFALGADNAVWQYSGDGFTWKGWQSLGGTGLYAPAAIARSPNSLDLFLLGNDHALYRKAWDGANWGRWENLGGFGKHGIAVASCDTQRLDCFVIGANNAVWQKTWNGKDWSRWQNLGGVSISAPTAVSWGTNRIDLFVIGSDRALYRKAWDGANWSRWENLGGFCLYAPTAISRAENQIDLFVIAGDHELYHKIWNRDSWSGWENLGGYCTSAPSAIALNGNNLHTFVLGEDSALWHKWQA